MPRGVSITDGVALVDSIDKITILAPHQESNCNSNEDSDSISYPT